MANLCSTYEFVFFSPMLDVLLNHKVICADRSIFIASKVSSTFIYCKTAKDINLLNTLVSVHIHYSQPLDSGILQFPRK